MFEDNILKAYWERARCAKDAETGKAEITTATTER